MTRISSYNAVVSTTSTGCTQVTDQLVECPVTIQETVVRLGDGDDLLHYEAGDWVLRYGIIKTGIGNDVVKIWRLGGDQLLGAYLKFRAGGGDDRLEDTQSFNDTADRTAFNGGPGADVLSGASVMQGSDGTDHIITGELPEQRARGGRGADRLVGSYGDDIFHGGPGTDIITDDNGGDDVVISGRGKDIVNVDDSTGDVGADDVNCGKGVDSVRVDWRDRAVNCERVRS